MALGFLGVSSSPVGGARSEFLIAGFFAMEAITIPSIAIIEQSELSDGQAV